MLGYYKWEYFFFYPVTIKKFLLSMYPKHTSRGENELRSTLPALQLLQPELNKNSKSEAGVFV